MKMRGSFSTIIENFKMVTARIKPNTQVAYYEASLAHDTLAVIFKE